MPKNNKDIRIGEMHINNQGFLMKIVGYNNANDITIEFQDEYRMRVTDAYRNFIRGMIRNPAYKIKRLGEERINNDGCLMRIIEYNNAKDIVVEFQDEHKKKIRTSYNDFIKGKIWNPFYRIGKTAENYQGCVMEIIKYHNASDIVVEFKDKYKSQVHAEYNAFLKGRIKNPYFPSVFKVGITGNKYSIKINGETIIEYKVWQSMLGRCFDEKIKNKNPSYQNVTCCDEWLLFDNFYEWLHSQENFDKWINNKGWHLDKDILIKGNKIYSPYACCLVPKNVNSLFTKSNSTRGNLPIGVIKHGNSFKAWCNNPFLCKLENIGAYQTSEEAFLAYKKRKEEIIKQAAEIEYSKGNITRRCYDAMMNYEVEITD